MTRLVHFAAAGAWVYLLLVGLATCASGAYLDRRLEALEHPGQFEGDDVFAALVAPVAVPLLWIVSAVVHGVGVGFVDECCRWFAVAGNGVVRSLFVAGSVLLVGVYVVRGYRDWRARHPRHSSIEAGRRRGRIRRAFDEAGVDPGGRPTVQVVDCDERFCAVRGLVRPRIEIADTLVDDLDDGALRAALLHELDHFESGDPLRTAAVSAARALNPFWGRLGRHATAWNFAREVRSDGRALQRGAEPAHLADALVEAARGRTGGNRCALCGDRGASLELRVEMLLDGATPESVGVTSSGTDAIRLAFASLAATVVAFPHFVGAELLELHCLLEWALV